VAPDIHAELIQQPAGQRASSDPCRCLPGARALEDVAGIDPIVLEDADQVGMARTRASDPAPPEVSRSALGRHDVFPVFPVPIPYKHRDRGAECLTGSHAGKELDLVAFDLHAGAAPIAHYAPGEIAVHPLRSHRQAGRQPLDNGNEGLSVRLAGCGKPQVQAETPLAVNGKR